MPRLSIRDVRNATEGTDRKPENRKSRTDASGFKVTAGKDRH